MTTIVKARYAGRSEKAREILVQLREHRCKLDRDQQQFLTDARRRLAGKLRSLRQKSRLRAIREAGLRSASALTAELFKLHSQFQSAIADAHDECLALSLRVAEEVIATEIPSLPATLGARIDLALQDLGGRRPLGIEVHPADEREIKQVFSSRRAAVPGGITADETIDRGKARIVTPSGVVHIDWREHLEQLKSELRAASRVRSSANKS